jgi:hypothetical protein
LSRDTFNVADTAAQVSMLMGRIILHPELNSPSGILSDQSQNPKHRLVVEISERFNLAQLKKESEDFDFTKRYLEAGLGSDPSAVEPHLSFKVGQKKVASAVVSLDFQNYVPGGASLGSGDGYDTSGGPSRIVTIVVTVNGLSMSKISGDTADEPGTVITSMFRELI